MNIEINTGEKMEKQTVEQFKVNIFDINKLIGIGLDGVANMMA